jgi:NAD(P)-dependent dehydrogenase (short-subunit alcohol dehydrogenase family)
MELSEAVVVVTGAARGVGRAIAEAFAGRGARVALVDVLADQLAETAAQMRVDGWTVLPAAADITVPSQVEEMAARVEAELGPIDVLVNNAGTFSVIAPVWEADPERWFRDVRTNLYGTFLVCRAVVKGMVARTRKTRQSRSGAAGYVINIVSSGGVGDPHPYSTSYASSKTGSMRLTEGLAAEVREHGIVVFAVAPPAILTDMTRFILDDPGGKKWRPGFERIFERGEDYPPEAVAELCVKLVSGRADVLTGRYLLVSHDLEDLLARADEIVERDLLTLRIRQDSG